MNNNKNIAVHNIYIFAFFVLISGWLGVLLDSILVTQPQGDTLGMGVWLVMPLLTALLIILFSKGIWKELGMKPNFKANLKWYLVSVLIFPVVTFLVMLIGVAANWIDLSMFNTKTFILTFCRTLLVNLIIDIFEETAWRGFLTSQLIKLKLSDIKLYLIVTCIWSFWHLPYYLVFLPEADIRAVMPVGRVVYIFIAFTTFFSWTIMFTEIFRVTKSVWPCVILHMIEDSLINHLAISGYINIASGREILISPINGALASILYIAVGLGIRAYRLRQIK